MKYGLILVDYCNFTNKIPGYNIGDAMQTIALYDAYKAIGIEDDSLIFVNMQDLKTYDGEKVLLPIIGIGVGGEYTPPYSPQIIPVFIGTHFVDNYLSDEERLYLLNYSPIGCRDEYTLNTMKRYGIPAYLSGCITIILKNRNIRKRTDAIYFIDEPEGIWNYIPEQIKKGQIVKETHLLSINKENDHETETLRFLNVARERIELYASAKMVVSSRMHALVPALACGTPVIGAFFNISYRFSWIDKYIHLYSEKDFAAIDWRPDPVDFSYVKKLFLDSFCNAVLNHDYKKDASKLLNDFYINREKAEYGNHYRDKIKSFFDNSSVFEYIIWGCGLIGNTVWNIMNEEYPNAKLLYAVDSFFEGLWHDVEVIRPEQLLKKSKNRIIIATFSGKEQAYEVLKKANYIESVDFVYVATTSG